MDGMSGGDKLMEHLQSIAKGLSSGDDLKVGFLEGAKYPDGTPVALVAATNEFGGTVKIPAHTRDLNFTFAVTVFRASQSHQRPISRSQ